MAGDIWKWLTSDPGTAVATWLSFFVSIIGVPFAVGRSSKARGASRNAVASAYAAQAAITSINEKIVISNASYAEGQLNTLLYMIHKKDYLEAERHSAALKRALLQLHFEKNSEQVNKALRALDTQLAKGRAEDPKYKQNLAVKAVGALIEHLATLQKSLTKSSKSET